MLSKRAAAICGVTLVFLLGSAAGAAASSKFKVIKASLNPALKVELNGELLNSMKALIYEGTTYLPVRNVAAMAALNERIEYDAKNNTLILGGPMYLSLFSQESKSSYQLVVNGNWGPSFLTNQHKMYSNSYMGIDFYFENVETGNLESYVTSVLKQTPWLNVTNKTNISLAKQDAIELTYETTDSVGKLAIVQNGTDFVTLKFFVDKTKFKAADNEEFEKIKKSFNIQTVR